MRRRLSPLLASLALGPLAACISEEDFPARFTAASCDLAMACAGEGVSLFEDRADCEGFYDEALGYWTAACDYDPYLARDCVRAIEDATCDDRSGLPEACDDVWTGPDCTWGGGDSD